MFSFRTSMGSLPKAMTSSATQTPLMYTSAVPQLKLSVSRSFNEPEAWPLIQQSACRNFSSVITI